MSIPDKNLPPVGPHPAAGKPKPPAPPATLSQGQQGAYDLLSATLKSWGLETLLGDLRGFILAGDTSPDTLSLKLSQTDAYKKRFIGNEQRKANGLGELNPAQYIALEEQYSNVLRSYGLPAGFYDSQKDFTDFIGKDLSPDELRTRAQIAHDQYTAAPQYMKELWGQYFGSQGDALAAIIDPETATAVIQDRAKQVGIGAAGAQNGFGVSGARAKQFADSGVTLQGAQQAYQQIAAIHGQDQTIANRFGTQFTQQDEENDLLLGQGAANQKRRAIYGSEEALFKGSSGLDQQAIGVSQSGP